MRVICAFHSEEYRCSSHFASESTAGESSNNWTVIHMSKSGTQTVASSVVILPFAAITVQDSFDFRIDSFSARITLLLILCMRAPRPLCTLSSWLPVQEIAPVTVLVFQRTSPCFPGTSHGFCKYWCEFPRCRSSLFFTMVCPLLMHIQHK